MNQLPYIAQAVELSGAGASGSPCQVYGVLAVSGSGLAITDGNGGASLFINKGASQTFYSFPVPLKFTVGPYLPSGGDFVLFLGPTP